MVDRFHQFMNRPAYRERHSLNSKWRDISARCQLFATEYKKSSDCRASGSSDEQVLRAALKNYQDKHTHQFSYLDIWDIVRYCPKWCPVPDEVRAAKRSKTTESSNYSAGGSDAHCNANLNLDADVAVVGYSKNNLIMKT